MPASVGQFQHRVERSRIYAEAIVGSLGWRAGKGQGTVTVLDGHSDYNMTGRASRSTRAWEEHESRKITKGMEEVVGYNSLRSSCGHLPEVMPDDPEAE
jgi:hypothetical protein